MRPKSGLPSVPDGSRRRRPIPDESADAMTIRPREEDNRIRSPSLTGKSEGGFEWGWLFWALVVGGIMLFAVLWSGG